MSNETIPEDNTPPNKTIPPEVLEQIYKDIVGKGDPDRYLLPYAKPTLDQQLHRAKAVEVNQPDRLS